jgi:enamine deaminase RidA (YjgF/YER057c/UK114 family)
MNRRKVITYSAAALALVVAPRAAISQTNENEMELLMASRKYLRLPEELERLWGLSQAVQIGNTIHFAGFLPIGNDGNAQGKTLAEQTEAVYGHVGEALKYFGIGVEHIIDEIVWVKDMAAATSGAMAARNAFYAKVTPPPPMTLLGVTELAHPACLIEVKILAQAPTT